jgi:hypothetical protein
MKKTTPTLIASAPAAAAVAPTPTAHAGPTVKQLCDAQSWPRPVPDAVGMLFEPVEKDIPAGTAGGGLACWDNIRASPPTAGTHRRGRVAGRPSRRYRPHPARPSGDTTRSPIETDDYVAPGLVEPRCTYRSAGHTAVESALHVTGAFAVDAAADYSRYTGEPVSEPTGLGLAARCLTGLDGAQHRPYNEVVVLLDGNRLFIAKGLGAEPCAQLTQFARAAINGL